MITCYQCQYPNQTEVEVCNYCGDFTDNNNVYYKYLALEEDKKYAIKNSAFNFKGIDRNMNEGTLFDKVTIYLFIAIIVFVAIVFLGLLFFNQSTNSFLDEHKLCFLKNRSEICLPMAFSSVYFEGTYSEIEINTPYKGEEDVFSYYLGSFFDALIFTPFNIIYLGIIWFLSGYLFLHPLTFIIQKLIDTKYHRSRLKNLETKLTALKPEYEKLKLLLNTNAKHLKQAISTSYLQIIRLKYELIDTEKTIDESQNSRVISEQERSQILENLKSIQQQLKTNYSKFVAHFTELKLIYHLSYFELLRVNYEKEGEVDEQEIDTLINEIKKTEDFILPIASKDEKVKLGKFKSLVLKYKKLDDREALQAKLARASSYINKAEGTNIDPEISGDLDFEFMLAESYEKYHEKYWNDYEKMLVPVEN